MDCTPRNAALVACASAFLVAACASPTTTATTASPTTASPTTTTTTTATTTTPDPSLSIVERSMVQPGDDLLAMCEEVSSPDDIPSIAPGEGIEGDAVRPHLSADHIRAVIREQLPAVRSCYEVALLGEPDRTGTVRVRFLIGPDGTVAHTSVIDNSTESEGLGCCVASRILPLQFDPSEGGGVVSVTYPFVLQQG